MGLSSATFGPDLALTIGGPRESEAPGIYARAIAFIGALLDRRTPSGSARNKRRAPARWRMHHRPRQRRRGAFYGTSEESPATTASRHHPVCGVVNGT